MSTPAPRGLAEHAAAHLRGLVLTGTLKPGEKIDQDAIAEALGISRSPVREAVVILDREGILELTPRRGATVASLAPEDIVDHYELIGVVAGRAAAMAAGSLSDDQIVELKDLHERFSSAEAASISTLNHEFHRLINTVAPRRTRWLLGLLERSVPEDFFVLTDGWDADAVGHHAAILDAIAARRPDEARRAMEEHLRASGRAAAEALRAAGFWDDHDDAGGQ